VNSITLRKTCFLCKRNIGFLKSGVSKKWIESYHGIPPAGFEDDGTLCSVCFQIHHDEIFPSKKSSFKVTFKNQSNLTIVMGILAIIGSFGIWMMPFGSSGSGGGIIQFIYWIIAVMFGIALISLGQRKVPDYDTFFDAISEFVEKAMKDSSKLKDEN